MEMADRWKLLFNEFGIKTNKPKLHEYDMSIDIIGNPKWQGCLQVKVHKYNDTVPSKNMYGSTELHLLPNIDGKMGYNDVPQGIPIGVCHHNVGSYTSKLTYCYECNKYVIHTGIYRTCGCKGNTVYRPDYLKYQVIMSMIRKFNIEIINQYKLDGLLLPYEFPKYEELNTNGEYIHILSRTYSIHGSNVLVTRIGTCSSPDVLLWNLSSIQGFKIELIIHKENASDIVDRIKSLYNSNDGYIRNINRNKLINHIICE